MDWARYLLIRVSMRVEQIKLKTIATVDHEALTKRITYKHSYAFSWTSRLICCLEFSKKRFCTPWLTRKVAVASARHPLESEASCKLAAPSRGTRTFPAWVCVCSDTLFWYRNDEREQWRWSSSKNSVVRRTSSVFAKKPKCTKHE